MTSNSSQHKLDSLKGMWGGKTDKHYVSLQTQSEAEHNYQDGSMATATATFSIQPSRPLNQEPFRNESPGEKAAGGAGQGVLVSFLNTRCKPASGKLSRKSTDGQRGNTQSLYHSVWMLVSTSMVAINNTHESQRKSTVSLETQQPATGAPSLFL